MLWLLLLLLFPLCDAYIVLLPPDYLVPTDQSPPASRQRFLACALFRLPLSPSPPGAYVQVKDANLTKGCQLVHSPGAPPTLLLLSLQRVTDAGCISPTSVLDSATALGLTNTTLVGFYGHDSTLFDSAGPFSLPSPPARAYAVQGVAVDPSFVYAISQQLASSGLPAYAYLQPEPGIYNDLVSSVGFYMVRGTVLFILVVCFLYGLSHYMRPLCCYLYYTHIKGEPSLVECISPFKARFWRPYLASIARVTSMYCILAWAISWKYAAQPRAENALHYSTLFAAVLGFCFMVYRWCGFALRVRCHALYCILSYWSLIEIPVAFLALMSCAMDPWFVYHGQVYQVKVILMQYVLQPSLALLSFVFCVASFRFLQEMKRLSLNPSAIHSLRKITILSLVGFLTIFGFAVGSMLMVSNLVTDLSVYLLFLILQLMLWVMYHSLMFYLLSVPVPSHGTNQATPSEFDVPSSPPEPMEVESLHPPESPHTKWNKIVLHGRPHSAGDKGMSVPSSSDTPVFLPSHMSLSAFNTPTTEVGNPFEWEHYFDDKPPPPPPCSPI